MPWTSDEIFALMTLIGTSILGTIIVWRFFELCKDMRAMRLTLESMHDLLLDIAAAVAPGPDEPSDTPE